MVKLFRFYYKWTWPN